MDGMGWDESRGKQMLPLSRSLAHMRARERVAAAGVRASLSLALSLSPLGCESSPSVGACLHALLPLPTLLLSVRCASGEKT